MSTSGGTLLNAVLYLAAVVAGLQAGLQLRRAGSVAGLWHSSPAGERFRNLVSAAAIWLAVAVPSLLQLRFPAILTGFERDPDLIRRHGQWWRLVTSVAAQDGGLGGTAFNLALLVVVLAVAVPVWGWWRAPLLFLAGQLAFDLFAVLVSDDHGAGNSGATFALAAGLAGLAVARALRSRVPPARPGDNLLRGTGVLLRFAVVPVAGALLLFAGDAHGFAFLVGGLLGVGAGLPARNSLIGEGVWQDGRRDAHG